MNENILKAFKNELGYVNATNQYVELSVRLTERNYDSDLKSDLHALAKTVNLNVSALTEDYMVRVSKSYIVNIHSCFENFLKTFKTLPGSPTNITTNRKAPEDSWLRWTINVAFNDINEEIKNNIRICEYYRLIRNVVVHNGELSSEAKSIRSSIRCDDNSRLKAPNDINSLTFDDQVLFSRAAFNVAKYIFNNCYYDINAIIQYHKCDLLHLIKPLQEPVSRHNAAKKLKRFISLLYPELSYVNWEEEVNNLLN